jgi:hypothetical protein
MECPGGIEMLARTPFISSLQNAVPFGQWKLAWSVMGVFCPAAAMDRIKP